MILFAEFGDFLDDLALLVDLDRVNTAIFPAVFGIFDRLAEGFVDFRDAGMQQIAETEENGQVSAAVAQTVDDLEQRDFRLGFVIFKANGDVALFVHIKKAMPPSLDTVELGRFLRSPSAFRFALARFGGRNRDDSRSHGRGRGIVDRTDLGKQKRGLRESYRTRAFQSGNSALRRWRYFSASERSSCFSRAKISFDNASGLSSWSS